MNTETETIEAEDTANDTLQLKLDVQEKSACERHVTVVVPRSDIERYYQKQFDTLLPRAEVPGFRVGRAPRQLVEKKFRKQVADQVKSSLLMDSLTQISDGEHFSAISEPDLDFEQVVVPDEGDLTYEFNIEVRPEFDLPKWKGLKLTRPEREFTDDDIQEEIARLAGRSSVLVPVEEPVQMDDRIVCNLTSKLDGKVVSESEEVVIEVCEKLILSDATIDGFDKLVVGKKAEDTVSTKVTVSEFSENAESAGKEIELEIEILDVKRIEAMSADEFATSIGMDAAELKKLVSEGMVSRLEYRQRESVRDQICKTLTDSANWELPPDLLRRQSRRELERSIIELQSSGFSEDEIRERENRLRQDVMEKTRTLLQEHFILEKIAEDQDVQETEADFDLEFQRIATQQNDSPRRVRAKLERTGQIDSLRNMIIERKVIDLITEAATFKATKFELPGQSESAAIDFYAGGAVNQIPEAKHDVGEDQPIAGVKPERS